MRRIAAIILALAFIIVSVTGIQMIAIPREKPQKLTQQAIENKDIGKNTGANAARLFNPKKVHEAAGFIFIGAGLVHLVFNRKPMRSYLRFGKNRGKRLNCAEHDKSVKN
jgi:hypothetical protein